MTQGILAYKYEEEKKPAGMTAHAGLPVWLDLTSVPKCGRSHQHPSEEKTQGWTDEQIIWFLVLLNLAGETTIPPIRAMSPGSINVPSGEKIPRL